MLALAESKFDKYNYVDTYFDKKFLAISGISFSIIGGIASWLIFDKYLKYREHKDNKRCDHISLLSEIQNRNPKIQQRIQTKICQQNSRFFTDSKNQIIQNSFVIIVGQGGVGSHVTSSLVRSGVRKVRVIDFDQVTVSS